MKTVEEPMAQNKKQSVFEKVKKTYDIVTMGEVLLRLAALPRKRICDGKMYSAYIGGSELNVCSGAARLGLNSAILTCIPQNDIGKYAIREISRMGVDTDFITLDKEKDARLGTYYSESGAAPRKPKVVYDRANSSLLKLDLSKLPEHVYSETRLFHISGITLASEELRSTAVEAIRRFRKGGALISLDINYRANLWDEKTAYDVLSSILPMVDILFVSEESSRRMFHKAGTLEEIMKSYHEEYGVQIVATSIRKVISSREHAWNSIIYSAETDAFFRSEPYQSISVVDRIGSGDAFDAGVLYGLLGKSDGNSMSLYGDAMAVLKCTMEGDLPDIDYQEVESLIAAHESNDTSEMIR